MEDESLDYSEFRNNKKAAIAEATIAENAERLCSTVESAAKAARILPTPVMKKPPEGGS
jgi:hypothetical protein